MSCGRWGEALGGQVSFPQTEAQLATTLENALVITPGEAVLNRLLKVERAVDDELRKFTEALNADRYASAKAALAAARDPFPRRKINTIGFANCCTVLRSTSSTSSSMRIGGMTRRRSSRPTS